MPSLIVSLVVDEEEGQPEVFAPLRPELLRQLRPIVEKGLQGDQRPLRQGMLADDVPLRRRPDAVCQIIGDPDGAGEQGGLARGPEVMDPRVDETPRVVGFVLPAGVPAEKPPFLPRTLQRHVGMEPAVRPLRPPDGIDDRVQSFVQSGVVPYGQQIGDAPDHLADQAVVPGGTGVPSLFSPGHPFVVFDGAVLQKLAEDVRNRDGADLLQIGGEERVRDLDLADIGGDRTGRAAENTAHILPPVILSAEGSFPDVPDQRSVPLLHGNEDRDFFSCVRGAVGGVDGQVHLPVRVGKEHPVAAVVLPGHGLRI